MGYILAAGWSCETFTLKAYRASRHKAVKYIRDCIREV